ncbi:ABC transporter permease [Nibrella saemangeumensis]|uniref:ABC transporter permease n=1 Tax=Nibrella saemangeumensis TaxID=1084526 RepID=A0ABP8ME52_9BACT
MHLPTTVTDLLTETGAVARFTSRFWREGIKPRYEWQEFLRQCYLIGYQSLPLVGITAFIMGLVMTLQSRPTMARFGAESWIPSMVALSIIREIGPVITALICAGKIGSSIGAELGSMKVTEQIDAMEVSGTNPFKYLVATRILAATLTLPLLAVLADAIAIYASYIGVNMKGVTSLALFMNNVFDNLAFSDVLPAVIKTFFFGFAIGLIGCFKGYNSDKGTEGVGRSANSAVVISSLLIFIIDLIAVQITDLLGFN